MEGAVIQVFDLRVMTRLFIAHTVTPNTEQILSDHNETIRPLKTAVKAFKVALGRCCCPWAGAGDVPEPELDLCEELWGHMAQSRICKNRWLDCEFPIWSHSIRLPVSLVHFSWKRSSSL